jgi:hypothetical protein
MGRKLHPIASPEQEQVAQAQYQQEMAASSDCSYNGQTADRVARAAWSACYSLQKLQKRDGMGNAE